MEKVTIAIKLCELGKREEGNKSFGKALTFYLASAELGNIESCYKVGFFLKRSLGVDNNIGHGADFKLQYSFEYTHYWLFKAADANYAAAFFELGDMVESASLWYYDHLGGPSFTSWDELGAAIYYYNKGAALGDNDCVNALSRIKI